MRGGGARGGGEGSSLWTFWKMGVVAAANFAAGFGIGYIYALYKHGWRAVEERGVEGGAEEEVGSEAVREVGKEVEKGGGEICVTRLYVYPIKACAGVSVESARVTDRGLENDRLFMIVDFRGRSVTQKKEPRLALIRPRVEGEKLVIEAPGMETLVHGVRKWGTKQVVEHLMDKCEGIDQGDVVAGFLEEFLGVGWKGVRLVRMREGFVRRVDERFVEGGRFETSFSDGWPYLLAGEESLKEVEERVGRGLDMVRFRPNLVVGGGGGFVEDGWKRIRVGEVCEFEMVNLCTRCKVTTVDPRTGVFDEGNQPIVALREFRKVGATVVFGQNMVPVRNARGKAVVKVGDSVAVLKRAEQVTKPDGEVKKMAQ